MSTDSRYPYFRDYTLDMATMGAKVVFPCHEYSGFSVEFKQGGGGLISVAQTNDDPVQIVNPQWFLVTGYDNTLDSSFTTLSSPALVDFPAVGAWAKVEVTSTGTGTAIVRIFLKSTRAVSAVSLIPSATPFAVETIADYKTVRLDEDATYTYIGKAEPGTETSSASWQIQRMTNADTTILFADGNSAFDKIWDNRASLTYS